MNKLTMPPIGAPGITTGPVPSAKSQPVQGTGFGEIINESIKAVSNRQKEAGALSEGLLSGQHSNIHETMIAMEKSSISFRMLTKVQTKVVDAYKEVMRLQL